MANNKVTIIGAGNVGSTIAYTLNFCHYIHQIALIDLPGKMEKIESEILDITHGLPLRCSGKLYAGDYPDCRDSKIIIIAAGRNRLESESRIDLLSVNAHIISDVVTNIAPFYKDSIVILITNPNDMLAHMVHEIGVFPYSKFFATGCILDSSRFISQMVQKLQLKNQDIKGYVAGEHGEMQFILWSHLKLKNKAVNEYCQINNIVWNDEIMDDIQSKTKSYGSDIIKGKAFTNYGIASCVLFLVDSIINDIEIIVSICCEMMGEFDIVNVAMSLPTIINGNGIRERVIHGYTKKEVNQLYNIASYLKQKMHKHTRKIVY